MTRPAVMNFHIGLWIALFFNLFSNAAGEDIIINPWQLRAANLEYENLNVIVGDSITFFWPVNESYSVSINPSGNCDDRGAIFLGDSSPISYTFTASDALDTTLGNPVFFADNIGANCEWGMRFYAEVYFPDSISPTEVPTETPTEMPTPSPTALASETPTFSPSAVPTVEASMTPTDIPTNDPTQSPTGKPTTSTPTAGPTLSPTVTPGEPTGSPTTANPTRSPTRNPTPIPTAKPTKNPTNEPVQPTEKPTSGGAGQEVSDTLTGLQMGMGGITDLTLEAELEWQRLTESFSTEYVGNDLRDSVSNFVTSYEITNVRSARRNRQLLRGEYEPSRNLQNEQDIVIVTYTQRLEYITVDPQTYSPDFLVGVPFETDSARSAYVSLLKSSNNPVLAEINGVSKVNVPEPAPSSPPTEAPAPSPVLSKPAIIGISCGGAGLLILVILFAIYCRSGNNDGNDNKSSGVPPLQVDVRNDEISTLGGPSGPPTYGDRSVATVDYDYSKAYGGAGDTSVSSAGGTFGSNTQNISLPNNAAATGAALGAMDDNSYNAQYDAPGNRIGNEEIIHIFAPPGKLGVVIDTPDDGAPVVHAVKDTSVIADRIIVGDKLVAVDDEDVRSMTAIKVSKMISRKGANPSRKLTIVRTVAIDE